VPKANPIKGSDKYLIAKFNREFDEVKKQIVTQSSASPKHVEQEEQ